MQVGSQALTFLFLEFDRGVQQQSLLGLLHGLYLFIKAFYPSLVKNNKDDQAYSKQQHAHSAQ